MCERLLKTGMNNFFAMSMTDMKAVTRLQQDRREEKVFNDENRKRMGGYCQRHGRKPHSKNKGPLGRR